MPQAKKHLHGSAPDQCPVALLLIDVVNPMRFPEADQLLQSALPAAQALAKLKRRAKDSRVPVIYVNDNFGRWRSDLKALVREALQPDAPGRVVTELLSPDDDDYFVVKPKHSGFFSTTLELLLRHLGVQTVVLTGFAANICVLFTANDAYMRDLKLFVPADCTAANTREDCAYALRAMRELLRADVRNGEEIDWRELTADQR